MQIVFLVVGVLVFFSIVAVLDFLLKSPVFWGVLIATIISSIIYFLYKKQKEKLAIQESIQKHLRLKNQEMERALAIIENPTPVSQIVDVSDVREITVIELTEEEKIAQIEKNADLEARKTAALIKKREAERAWQRVLNEEAAEEERRQRQLEKEKNQPPPPPPPMTPDEKVQAILEMDEERSKNIQKLRDAGHAEDSMAISAMQDEYQNKLKALRNVRTSK